MPELPRVHRYSDQKRRATTLFVDREDPQALFRRELDLLGAARPAPALLTFYGVGGQGKTALCRQFGRIAAETEIAERGIRCALVDLQQEAPAGEWHAYVAIRNAVAAATGASFPCFDLAFADFWSRAEPHRPAARLGGSRLAGFGADAAETVSSTVAGLAKDGVAVVLDGWAKTIADVSSEVAGGLPFIGPLLKRTSNWAIAAGYQALLKHNAAALERLYGQEQQPDAAVILDHLADILAHELALHLKRRKQQLVLLIDEYERAMLGGGSEGVFRSDPWDQGLRSFYASCALGAYDPADGKDGYAYAVPMLLIVFGREKLRWDEIDSSWRSDLEQRQHLLDGLGADDAEHFLVEAGVEPAAIRAAIAAAATAFDPMAKAEAAYPLMLDMSVQLYYDLLASGQQPNSDDFELSAASYTAKRGKLLHRILQRYPVELRDLLRRLACARAFDQEIVAALVRAFAIPFDMIRFADLERLSFITASDTGDWLTIHSHIRDTLIASLSPTDLRATRELLLALYTERATPAGPRPELRHAGAFAEAIRLQAEGGFDDDTLFQSARTNMFNSMLFPGVLVGALREAVVIERTRPDNWHRLTEALYRLAWLQSTTREASEAIRAAEEGIALVRDHAPADDERTARLLYLIARAHQTSGDYESARVAFEQCLAIRLTLFAADDNRVMATASGVAAAVVELGRPLEAIDVFADLLDRARTANSNNPMIAQLAYNLASAHQRAGNPERARETYDLALTEAERHFDGTDPLIAKIVSNLGLLLLDLDEFDSAELLFQRSLEIAASNNRPPPAYTLLGLAKIYRSRGEFAAVLDALRAIGTDALPADLLMEASVLEVEEMEMQALAQLGQMEEAGAVCDRAIDRARSSGEVHRVSDLLGHRAQQLIVAGAPDAAMACCIEQIDMRRTLFQSPSVWIGRPLRILGGLCSSREDAVEADRYFAEAHEQLLGGEGADEAEIREVTLLAGMAALSTDQDDRGVALLASCLEQEPISAVELLLLHTGSIMLACFYAGAANTERADRAFARAEHYDALLAADAPRGMSLEQVREAMREAFAEAGIAPADAGSA